MVTDHEVGGDRQVFDGKALAEARGEIGAIIAQAGDGAEMLDDIMAGPVATLIAKERAVGVAEIERLRHQLAESERHREIQGRDRPGPVEEFDRSYPHVAAMLAGQDAERLVTEASESVNSAGPDSRQRERAIAAISDALRSIGADDPPDDASGPTVQDVATLAADAALAAVALGLDRAGYDRGYADGAAEERERIASEADRSRMYAEEAATLNGAAEGNNRHAASARDSAIETWSAMTTVPGPPAGDSIQRPDAERLRLFLRWVEGKPLNPTELDNAVRAVLTVLAEQTARADTPAGQVAGLPEWRCPGCGAVTRARMADHDEERQ